jgi:S1-C subfamily serine protease
MEATDSSNKPRAVRSKVTLVVTFIIVCSMLAGGFIGYSLNTSSASGEIIDLQNQVKSLQDQIIALETANSSQYQVIPENVSLSQLYQNVRDSIVVITDLMVESTAYGQQTVEVQGSGFVYNFTGRMVIVTNNHVVEDATNISVTFSDGDAYVATVLGSDEYSDLAVLSSNAPANEFEPLQIASSSTLEVGDFVAAVGSPFGLAGSMTTGIVSQLGRTITEPAAGNYPIADMIQTSTPINSGNSGGPLLNDKGQVVGITTAVVTDSQGLGFAIPSNTILREIASLVDTGSYTQHPWLGIGMTDMTFEIANAMGLNTTYGVLIAQIISGGPADKAGLEGGTHHVTMSGGEVVIGGDVIIAVNGNRIIDSDSLSTYLEENTRPNQTITLTIVRSGASIDVSILLGTRPSQS